MVLVGNFAGSLFFAWLMLHSRLWEGGEVAWHAVALAAGRTALPFEVGLIRGLRCNWLVCLAVFMAVAARDIPGKTLACLAPIKEFVTSGFKHSVANMDFIPTGVLIQSSSAPRSRG